MTRCNKWEDMSRLGMHASKGWNGRGENGLVHQVCRDLCTDGDISLIMHQYNAVKAVQHTIPA
jgi:hypothetical protein